MEMTKSEFNNHFSNAITKEIKEFGREALLKEGLTV